MLEGAPARQGVLFCGSVLPDFKDKVLLLIIIKIVIFCTLRLYIYSIYYIIRLPVRMVCRKLTGVLTTYKKISLLFFTQAFSSYNSVCLVIGCFFLSLLFGFTYFILSVFKKKYHHIFPLLLFVLLFIDMLNGLLTCK